MNHECIAIHMVLGCTAISQNPTRTNIWGPRTEPNPSPRSTSGVMVLDFSALLSLGTGVIRRWWLVLRLSGTPGGNPPAAVQCVCVRPHREGRMRAIEHPATAPATRTPCSPPHPFRPPAHSDVQSEQILWHQDKSLPLFLSFSSFLFPLCHQSTECRCLGPRHRDCIQTDTITFHFCFVIARVQCVPA